MKARFVVAAIVVGLGLVAYVFGATTPPPSPSDWHPSAPTAGPGRSVRLAGGPCPDGAGYVVADRCSDGSRPEADSLELSQAARAQAAADARMVEQGAYLFGQATVASADPSAATSAATGGTAKAATGAKAGAKGTGRKGTGSRGGHAYVRHPRPPAAPYVPHPRPRKAPANGGRTGIGATGTGAPTGNRPWVPTDQLPPT